MVQGNVLECQQTPGTKYTSSVSSASTPASGSDAEADDPPSPTYITMLVLGMKDALEQLNATNVTFQRLEEMAIFIHESMSHASRHYHSVQHVFDISKDLTHPIAILSAYFHDCIYCHVDGGLSPKQAKILEGTYSRTTTTSMDNSNPQYQFLATFSPVDYSTNDKKEDNDKLLSMVQSIFGYSQGQEVTTRLGLNEFLSAVVAVRSLESHLSIEQLAQIACCIESTIPFRQPKVLSANCNKSDDYDGADNDDAIPLPPLEHLYHNLKRTRDYFQLEISETVLVETIQQAALLSNSDVANFSSPDRIHFLDNSWSLLDETNETLRQHYLYSVKEFQYALYQLYSFFGFLKPSLVFHSFRGVPTQMDIDQKTFQCQLNLTIGKTYVGAKLLAVSLLTAFVELTGGDAPMSLFMGDLPSRHHRSQGLADYLPKLATEECLKRCDATVYNILSKGRRTETSFDILQSPLAAYLYGCLGDEKIRCILDTTKLYPMERAECLTLLSKMPRDIVNNIGDNISKVAISRADEIKQVLLGLPVPSSVDDSPA